MRQPYPIRGKAGAKDIDKSIRLVNILIFDFRTPRGAIGPKTYSCVPYPHQYPKAPVTFPCKALALPKKGDGERDRFSSYDFQKR